MPASQTYPLEMIDINLIEPNPNQPRQLFDQEALADLVTSIETHGILLPLLVGKKGERFQILSGERRFHAARHLNFTVLPAIVREVSERQGFEIALIENLQRQGLTALEEALAYDKMAREYKMTQEAIAEALGKSRSSVANVMRLLNLPEEMQKALNAGKITVGHAKILLGVESKIQQYRLFLLIDLKNLSVEETRRLAEAFTKSKKKVTKEIKRDKDLRLALWEDKILHILGSRVVIKGSMQKGQMVISYSSQKEFKAICSFFGDADVDYSTY